VLNERRGFERDLHDGLQHRLLRLSWLAEKVGAAGGTTAALAITGWRRGVASRGACALLALAGLVSLLLEPFPPGGLLAGIALAWTARSARGSDDEPNPRGI
jgi:hypothetical protein